MEAHCFCRPFKISATPSLKHITLRKLLLYIVITLCTCSTAAPALTKMLQKPKTDNDKKTERIVLKHADNLRFAENEMNGAQRFSGNVVMSHAGMTMHCDSAVLFEESQTFNAFGKVRIVQGLSLIHI